MAQSDNAGPVSWRNWKARIAGASSIGTIELRLYSDAWFIAEARDHGPYTFLNAVPRMGRSGLYSMKPAIVLRVDDHIEDDRPDLKTTQDEDYHGGGLTDEIAALCAVILGVRIVAGPVERDWGFDWHEQDPLGRPRAHAAELLPSLAPAHDAPQIPDLLGQRDLRRLKRIDRFPYLEAPAARALIKSARLYQQALWIADTTPETAWLLLVSAMETAAAEWDGSAMSPVDRLKEAFPAMAEHLATSTDSTVLDVVAETLRPLTRASARFLDFAVAFAPEPPQHRPRWGQVDFEPSALRRSLKVIYTYRSRALHAGTPFPHPMCAPPRGHDKDAPEETPGGLASGSRGSSWLAKDTPMLLHVFAYIVRGALLRWWTSIDPEATEPPEHNAAETPPE